MNRRYVRMTSVQHSGKPVEWPVAVAARAGASEWLAWLCAAPAAALGFILLVGAG